MFSGIIAAVGQIKHISTAVQGLCLTIDAGALDLADVVIGDSIAVNGVCLTVTSKQDHQFSAGVSRETLACTAGLDTLGEVNLEKALRLADRLGGHLVSGHVDGVAEVVSCAPAGESVELVLRAPDSLAKYIARKGSVTLNGVSLTVNSVTENQLSLNLIPHTLTSTTLKNLQAGGRVNLEVDLIARYVERILGATA